MKRSLLKAISYKDSAFCLGNPSDKSLEARGAHFTVGFFPQSPTQRSVACKTAWYPPQTYREDTTGNPEQHQTHTEREQSYAWCICPVLIFFAQVLATVRERSYKTTPTERTDPVLWPTHISSFCCCCCWVLYENFTSFMFSCNIVKYTCTRTYFQGICLSISQTMTSLSTRLIFTTQPLTCHGSLR